MPFNTHNPSPTHGPSVDTIQSGLEATVPSGEERTARTHDKKVCLVSYIPSHL